MVHSCQNRNLVSTPFNGTKKYFSMFSNLIYLKCKTKINVIVVTLAQITFQDALSFSILGERRRCLSY